MNTPIELESVDDYAETGNEIAESTLPVEQDSLEVDICPTPPELALAICEYVGAIYGVHSDPLRILEPSAGEGAFVEAARTTWPEAKIFAVEPRLSCRDALSRAGAKVYSDTLDSWLIRQAAPNLVIGNPPFSLAEVHIRMILENVGPGTVLALILKLSFYESKGRLPFWKEYPESWMAPIVPRPGFKLNKDGKKGTDSQAYGVFCWVAGHSDPIRLPTREPHIIWTPAKSPRKKREGDP